MNPTPSFGGMMRPNDVKATALEVIGICRYLDRNTHTINQAFQGARKDGFSSGGGDGRGTDSTSTTERAALINLARKAQLDYHNAIRRMRSAAEEADCLAKRMVHIATHGTGKVAATTEVIAENEYRCANPLCRSVVPEGVKSGRCEACRSHKRRTDHERVPFGEDGQGRKLDGTFASACQKCHSIEVAS